MKRTTITIIGWLISITLLAVLAAKINFHELWQGITKARWGYLISAAAINIVVVALRTIRWQWLMKPEKETNFWGIFKASMMGFAGNNVLPARGGDWFKIYLLGKWFGVSKAMLASITGLDKLLDGLAMLFLFGLLSFQSTFPEWVQQGTTIFSIVIAISLAICVLLLLHHRRTPSDRTDELGRLSYLAKKLGSGMSALADKKILVVTFITSIIICFLQIEMIRECQLAFGLSLPIWVPALVYVAVILSFAIPSAPSGVGPFEAAAVLAYAWLGIKTVTGFNVALMYHAVQFIPVTLIGLVFYFRTVHTKPLPSKEMMAEE